MSEFRTHTKLSNYHHWHEIEIVSRRDGTYLAIEGEANAWKTNDPRWFRTVYPGRHALRKFAMDILDHLDRTEDIVRKRRRKKKGE
jgi:hypothetical protein